MIIIFEGPDASGKSTLLRSFRIATDFEFVEMDRGHISRLAYAKFFKRPLYERTCLWTKAVDECKKFIVREDAVVVYTYATPDVLESRIAARGEEVKREPNSAEMLKIFDWVLGELNLKRRLLRLDTSANPSRADLVEQVQSRIIELEEKK